MFLDIWREKRVKRNLEEAVKAYSGATHTSGIKRVGLLVDATENIDMEVLSATVNDLQPHTRLNTIYYVNRVNKMSYHANSTFDNKALNWQGELSNAQLDFFLNQQYDLLISYYARALPILQFVTAKTNAHFKVGFPRCDDYRLNDLVIDTKPENITVFCKELKNYLKILKRIE